MGGWGRGGAETREKGPGGSGEGETHGENGEVWGDDHEMYLTPDRLHHSAQPQTGHTGNMMASHSGWKTMESHQWECQRTHNSSSGGMSSQPQTDHRQARRAALTDKRLATIC
ncbi:hypothetical protein BaRGS_00018166 [Batillaria attramentaria]|uniref:Uncharacterized protein n=1 Tax=Batillaria attramentaria TaxID=370345 RepID=A0ABD0KUF0_9CAEN